VEVNANRYSKERRNVADLLDAAVVPEEPFLRGIRYLVHPEIAIACAPYLRAIASALHDETQPVDTTILPRLRWFVADGASPFFGRDTAHAVKEAKCLLCLATSTGHGSLRPVGPHTRTKRPITLRPSLAHAR
jgi:hypothetical protein